MIVWSSTQYTIDQVYVIGPPVNQPKMNTMNNEILELSSREWSFVQIVEHQSKLTNDDVDVDGKKRFKMFDNDDYG